MTAPIRIQRKRTKGWRMPPNTVYVGRPTRWGNPFGANRLESCVPPLDSINLLPIILPLHRGGSADIANQSSLGPMPR
jgi:hypothetical protein